MASLSFPLTVLLVSWTAASAQSAALPTLSYSTGKISISFSSLSLPVAGKLYHAFFDTDSISSTGYAVPTVTLGADLMIESSAGKTCSPAPILNTYSGASQAWKWTPAGSSVSCIATSSAVTWQVLVQKIVNPGINSTCLAAKATFDYNGAFTSVIQLATQPAQCPPTVSSTASTVSFVFQASSLPAAGSSSSSYAFVDSDGLQSTGYLAGPVPLGAELMLVASGGASCSAPPTLYTYSGANQQWGWTQSATAVTCAAGNGLVSWTFPRSMITGLTATNPCASSQATFALTGPYTGIVPIPRTTTTCSQRLLVPSYWDSSSPLWSALWNSAPLLPPSPALIINPSNGDASSAEFAAFQPIVSQARAKGFGVLGYVYTHNGQRDITVAQASINKYLSLGGVAGIFLDEAAVFDCGSSLTYYQTLANYIHGRNLSVFMNPGTTIPECFLQVADAVLTFEDNALAYSTKFAYTGYEARHPASSFVHVIHTTSTALDMVDIVRLSKSRGAGWVYVTSDVLPNPYDALPSSSYWANELRKLKASSI